MIAPRKGFEMQVAVAAIGSSSAVSSNGEGFAYGGFGEGNDSR